MSRPASGEPPTDEADALVLEEVERRKRRLGLVDYDAEDDP